MRLAEYLIRNQITSTEFGAKIGVCSETVRRYVKGERFPNKVILARIEEVTKGKVLPNDLYTDLVPQTAA
jgi:hypothetical protein